MPKPLTPEQQTSLQDSGVLLPPSEAHPAVSATPDTTMRILGQVGLPSSEVVEKIYDEVDPSNPEMSEEVLTWSRVELDNVSTGGALGSWQRHEAVLGLAVPRNLSELIQTNPNLPATLGRLFQARQELMASGELTPGDLNVGETMHLVVMPWQALKDNRTNIVEWVNRMRATQNVTQADYFNPDLLRHVVEDLPIYRDITNPGALRTSSLYLERKIAQDGPWGVMLAQTSNQAGLKSLLGQSPDHMTTKGTTNIGLGTYSLEHPLDSMGIMEWLALTLQAEDPLQLSSGDYSWLLANRLNVSGVAHVPYGDSYGDRVRSFLGTADIQGGSVRPRLAVM